MCRFRESMECVCIFVGARIIFILAAFPAWRIHGQEGRRNDAGWSSLVARRAHNPEVIGSNPVPATTKPSRLDNPKRLSDLLFLCLSTASRIMPKIVLAPIWHQPWHQFGTKRIVQHMDKRSALSEFSTVGVAMAIPFVRRFRSADSNASLWRYLWCRSTDSNTYSWYRCGGSVKQSLKHKNQNIQQSTCYIIGG